jgi:glucose-1-phosphate thymidylyltransferase
MEASSFIQAIEERQGLKVGCLQEIAWRNGWIDNAEFIREAEAAGNSGYGSYLRNLAATVEVDGGSD